MESATAALPDAKIKSIRTLVCDTGQERSFLFVLVDTEAGVTGVGEGSQSNQDAAVVANVRQLGDRYMGDNVLELIERGSALLRTERSGRAMVVAWSAIEQALWDAAGKLLGVPVYQLLGGPAHRSVRCYATMAAGVGDQSPEGLAKESIRCRDLGYTAVKVVAFRDLQARTFDSYEGRRLFSEGVERIRAVREAIGPDMDIMVECAAGLDRNTSLRVAESLEPFKCFWLEAPLSWDNAEEMSRLRNAMRIRLASGETLHGRRSYREMIERQAVDVLQPDVKWTGGILEAKKIAAWAETYQMWIAPHNNSGAVATAASAHLAITLPNALVLEMPSRRPAWEDDLTRGSSVRENGEVTAARLRQRPGLGVDFDESVARSVAVEV